MYVLRTEVLCTVKYHLLLEKKIIAPLGKVKSIDVLFLLYLRHLTKLKRIFKKKKSCNVLCRQETGAGTQIIRSFGVKISLTLIAVHFEVLKNWLGCSEILSLFHYNTSPISVVLTLSKFAFSNAPHVSVLFPKSWIFLRFACPTSRATFTSFGRGVVLRRRSKPTREFASRDRRTILMK